MKSMLQHSFVLDALEETGADTFEHFELLIEEHRRINKDRGGDSGAISRLQRLVPTIGVFHTYLPLRQAFEVYNEKHRLTKRKHIQISFNEIRHILNLAQIMALRKQHVSETNLLVNYTNSVNDVVGQYTNSDSDDFVESLPDRQLNGPAMITFDGDQTLYSDGENFEKNPQLANYLYQLLTHGVVVAVVTAAGYDYMVRLEISLLRVMCRVHLGNEQATNSGHSFVWTGRKIRISLVGPPTALSKPRSHCRGVPTILSFRGRV
jgi:hypothetical protein